MRKQWLGCLAFGIVLLASPAAWAGHPQERHGFWIGFGGGYGSAGVNCDFDCEGGDRQDSFAGSFKLGGTLSDKVLLGVESNGWIKEEDGVTVTIGSLTGTLTFYPQASGGFFLKGGVGLSYIDTDVSDGSFSASLSKTGWGLLAGAGYDIRVGRNISITPLVNYYYGKPGDLDFEGETVFGGWSQDVVSFEVAITFH